MKIFWGIVPIGLLLASCRSEPQYPNNIVQRQAEASLPHFELKSITDAGLVSLSNRGELYCTGIGFEGRRMIDIWPASPTNPDSFHYLRYVDQEGPHMKNSSLLPRDATNYPALNISPIQIIEEGHPVGLIPLRLSTDGYRYYQSNRGFYAGDRKTGTISRIFDQHAEPAFLSKEDTLIVVVRRGPQNQVWRIGPRQKPQMLFEGLRFDKLLDISKSDEVMVQNRQVFVVYDRRGKEVQRYVGGNYDAKFLDVQGKQYVVGFIRVQSEDKEHSWTSPVIWKDPSTPVALSAQCPDLTRKVMSVKSLRRARVLCNATGWVAFEMSGKKPEPGEESSTSDNWSRNVEKTYLLQVKHP